MKVKFYYNHLLNIDIDTDKDVKVYIDRFPVKVIPAGSIRIIILEEACRDDLVLLVNRFPKNYNYVLTYRESLLETNTKARFFHCIDTWAKGYVSPWKRFSVSTVVGGKANRTMEGYRVRHELWKKRGRIEIVRKFYLSGHYKWKGANYNNELVLGASKTPLFDSQYHIAIENTSMNNYFTEKLIDCFQTLTVPIYYGADNIGEFFNADGIIQVNSVDEMVEACNNVTIEQYERMLPAMQDNFKRSEKWCDHNEQIKTAIVNLLKEIK